MKDLKNTDAFNFAVIALQDFAESNPTKTDQINLLGELLTKVGFDFDILGYLNREFVPLLKKHENDMDVQGESRAKFVEVTTDEKEQILVNMWAMAWNAWDELCGIHPWLRDSKLSWFAGAEFVGYGNEFDLYIGTGDEEYEY